MRNTDPLRWPSDFLSKHDRPTDSEAVARAFGYHGRMQDNHCRESHSADVEFAKEGIICLLCIIPSWTQGANGSS